MLKTSSNNSRDCLSSSMPWFLSSSSNNYYSRVWEIVYSYIVRKKNPVYCIINKVTKFFFLIKAELICDWAKFNEYISKFK